MNIKAMGVDGLLELLKSHGDTDHAAIVDECTRLTDRRLAEIAGDNRLARYYVQNLWKAIMTALDKAEIDTSTAEFSNILRVVADAIELRERLHKELHQKRNAESLRNTEKIVNINKDVQ